MCDLNWRSPVTGDQFFWIFLVGSARCEQIPATPANQECPSLNPACTALPDPSFPAETPPQTMEAWPGGVQPTPLQCWPRRSDGLPSRCRNQTASVLEDTEDGWPGQCDGMVKIVDLRGGETCQTRCMLTPLCSVWAIESSSDAYGAAVCWHGMLGHNCSHNSNGIRPSRAQRLQHGTYRVLMQTVGVQILGLHNSFGGTVYGDWQEGAKHCKLECRSYLLCQYWQYSRVYGCFLEMPQRSAVGYPLTTTGVFRSVNRNSEAARDIVAGEMIQHNCVGEMSAIPTAAPSAASSREPERPSWADGRKAFEWNEPSAVLVTAAICGKPGRRQAMAIALCRRVSPSGELAELPTATCGKAWREDGLQPGHVHVTMRNGGNVVEALITDVNMMRADLQGGTKRRGPTGNVRGPWSWTAPMILRHFETLGDTRSLATIGAPCTSGVQVDSPQAKLDQCGTQQHQ
ncbi:APPLE domain-containing protein [Durusdinium trenchii]|uniref:APPLE domain-containing protein n=1 Tax=Durusdinium trenchii TaxID=1381693 RepID=A0ABP0J4N6_9DINO